MWKNSKKGSPSPVPLNVRGIESSLEWLTVRELMGPDFVRATGIPALMDSIPAATFDWPESFEAVRVDEYLPLAWQNAWHSLLAGSAAARENDHFRQWILSLFSLTNVWKPTFRAVLDLQMSGRVAQSDSLSRTIEDITNVPGYAPLSSTPFR